MSYDNTLNNQYLSSEILIYLRKSRSDDPLLSVDEVLQQHKKILDDWITRNFKTPIPEENIYMEVVSGEQINNRPEMLKLLKHIESSEIKAVLVVEPQRLSRGDLEDCGRIIKLLRYTNTKVFTPYKIYDLQDEFDRDSFERELKRGNEYLEYFKKIQNRGRLASVAAGNYIGQTAPYGYEKIVIMEDKKKCHTLKPKYPEADVVRMIFDMYGNQGIALPTVARKLDAMGIAPPKGNNWSYNGLRDIVSNEHYIGKIRWNRRKNVKTVSEMKVLTSRPRAEEYIVVDGKHEALVDEELFYRCQHTNLKTPPKKNNTFLSNPLAGLIKCECGYAVNLRPYHSKSKKKQKTTMYSYRYYRYLCNHQVICHNASSSYQEVVDTVCDALNAQIENFTILSRKNASFNKRQHEQTLTTLHRRLMELENKELSLWDKYAEESMPKNIFDKLMSKVTLEKAAITAAIKEENDKTTFIDYSERIATFTQAVDALNDDGVSVETKNRFLKQCIESITYSRKRPERTGGNNGWSISPLELKIQMKL